MTRSQAEEQARALGHQLLEWWPLPVGVAVCSCRRCQLRLLDLRYTAGGSALSWRCDPSVRLRR